MCIRDRSAPIDIFESGRKIRPKTADQARYCEAIARHDLVSVSYTHLRAHETVLDIVCRLLLEHSKRKRTIRHNKTSPKHTTHNLIHTNVVDH